MLTSDNCAGDTAAVSQFGQTAVCEPRQWSSLAQRQLPLAGISNPVNATAAADVSSCCDCL